MSTLVRHPDLPAPPPAPRATPDRHVRAAHASDDRNATSAGRPAAGIGTDTATADVDPLSVRPTWRGWIHRVGVAVFVPLSVLAAALAPSGANRTAVIVYAVGVTVMLGTSAFYHCGRLGPSTMRKMKRIDHTTILLGIAGSYTAIAVLALPSGPATHLLVFTWVAALVGAVVRMAWLRAPYPVVALVYVAVGWGALLEWSALVTALSGAQLGLLLGGGIVYTAGAVVYALHRPNPWPGTFGYHEVFHALVMAGVTCHYVVVLDLVLALR